MQRKVDLKEVDQIIERWGKDSSFLIPILQDIQDKFRYLPRPALARLQEKLNLPLTRVAEVATFFKAFRLEPSGEHTCTVCMGTACHVRGAPRILDELKRRLKIEPGETTKDMSFTLETVNCLGACALGPIMVMDGKYYGQMIPSKVKSVLEQTQKPIKGKKK